MVLLILSSSFIQFFCREPYTPPSHSRLSTPESIKKVRRFNDARLIEIQFAAFRGGKRNLRNPKFHQLPWRVLVVPTPAISGANFSQRKLAYCAKLFYREIEGFSAFPRSSLSQFLHSTEQAFACVPMEFPSINRHQMCCCLEMSSGLKRNRICDSGGGVFS